MLQEKNGSLSPQTGRRARRARRAEALRKDALSPIRILKRLLLVPVIAAGIALSAYIRTSDHDPENALRHLVAMVGCGPAAAMGLAPAPEQDNRVRSVGGAKFVRP